jgi:hypothetical protein
VRGDRGCGRREATASGLPEILRRFLESDPRLSTERLALAAWAAAVVEAAKTVADEEALLMAAEAEVQADLPEICLSYKSVLQSHLAAGARAEDYGV